MQEMFDLVQLSGEDISSFFKELQEDQENQILNKLFDLKNLQLSEESDEANEIILANIVFDILDIVQNC